MVTREVTLERPRLKLAVIAVVVGLLGLALLIQAVEDSPVFGPWHNTILAANTLVAVALLVLILGNVWRLFQDLRTHTPGSRLKLRLLMAFATLATAPVVIVYLTAVVFLHRGIESWIDERVSSGLRQALTLSRSVLNSAQRADLNKTREIADTIATVPLPELAELLPGLRRKAGAAEVTIFGRNDRIIATNSDLAGAEFPPSPAEDVARLLGRDGSYVGFDTPKGGRLRVRATVTVTHQDMDGREPLSITAFYPLGEELSALADSVQTTYSRYGELTFLRGPIEYSFTLSLSVVVLLTLLGAAYVALVFAWRLVAPIQGLVAGTRAVALGNLDTRVTFTGKDDIGALVESFNEMTMRLGVAREEALRNAGEVESARANLAAVLARLTSGVIVTGADGTLKLANAAAATILRCDLGGAAGTSLAELGRRFPELDTFLEACETHTQRAPGGWREQLTFAGETGRRVLMCAATPMSAGSAGDRVLVFDDITDLLQAQRDAAWGEVARRLAHEIKNPLTPIQLSAERIRRRCLGNMESADAELVDRATTTIVQQVEAMRDMVNAFSDYARAPDLAIAPLNLNHLVREVAELYRAQPQPELRLQLDPALGEIAADRIRVRQLLHNLIRNAVDALEDRPDSWIEVTTVLRGAGAEALAEIRVRDNGPGIDPVLRERIFEPYVTSKPRGTGLGLAIVRRLVEEHGGTVTAENLPEGGTCITVTLPTVHNGRERDTDTRPRRTGEWRS